MPAALTLTLSGIPAAPPTALPEVGLTESHAAPVAAAVNMSVLPIASAFDTVSVCAAGICPGFAKKTNEPGEGTSEGPNVRLHALRPWVDAKSFPALWYWSEKTDTCGNPLPI